MTDTSAIQPAPGLPWPERCFAGRLSMSDALVPLALAAGAGVVLGHALQPFVEAAIAQALPAEAAARFAGDPDGLGRVRWIADVGAVFQPVLKAWLFAAMAFLVLGAAGEVPRFVSLYVCAAWSLLVLTVKSVAQYLMLAWDGPAAIRGPADLNPGTGFGFLAPTHPSLLFDMLDLINGFDIAFVALFAATIRVAAPATARQATAAAVLPWLALSAIRIGFNVLLNR